MPTGRRVGLVVVSRLLEEVVQVLAGDELEHEEEEAGRFECAMQGDDVWVGRERLVDVCLLVLFFIDDH